MIMFDFLDALDDAALQALADAGMAEAMIGNRRQAAYIRLSASSRSLGDVVPATFAGLVVIGGDADDDASATA